MPSIGDVSVHVLDSHGIRHEEWGVQRLHISKDQAKISAYIKSESGMAFTISVEAKLPYRDHNTNEFVPSSSEDSNNIYKRQRMRVNDSCRRRTDSWEGPTSSRHHHHNNSHDDDAISTISESYRNQKHQSSPIPTRSLPSSPPPFDLLATLYLDGREIPERRTIIYLDPAYEDFSPGTEGQGAIGAIKSRWVTGKDGNIYEQAWVFRDVGIEAVLDKMVLMANDNSPEKDEDGLVDAFNRTSMCLEEELKREESKKIGQIEVTIMRITIGKKKIDRHYRPKHQEGEDDDVDMERINSELCHTTAFSHIRALTSPRIPVISYSPYKDDEDPFAIFKFFYRSQATLEKFKFPGFQIRENRVVRKRNHMESLMNDMTPLGISNGRVSTSKSKRYEGKASFEEQIKKGRSKKEPVPEFNFDGQNRRLIYAKAEQSSQSDTDLPPHDSHRRPGVKGIKNGLCDEKDNISIPPDHDSVIAADRSAASSISSAQLDRKMAINDDPTLKQKDPYHGSPNGFNSRDPSRRVLPATKSLFSTDPLVKLQSNKVQKPVILSSFSAGKNTSRGGAGSDADDENEPTSDLETCASESDMEFDDDEGPSRNKDDDGLGEQLHETLRLNNTNGKRIRDADGELDKGESWEMTRHNTEQGQSPPEDARDELGEDGGRSVGDKAAGERSLSQGKRIKVAPDFS